MRRALQVLGSLSLSGLLMTGLTSTRAFAGESTEAETQAQQSTEQAKPEQIPAPPDAAAAPVSPAQPAVVATALAATAVAKPAVGDLSVHGYFRGGFGFNANQKGRMSCFMLNLGGPMSKYRLGNECEQWGEFHFTAVAYAGDDGSVATFHFMPTVYIPTDHIGYSPTSGTSVPEWHYKTTGATVAFPNLYADIKGISWLFGGTAWVGSRYYKRESVYISDFFYWNPSGMGAGLEDLHLGRMWAGAPDALRDVTFSWAVFAVDGEPIGDPPLPQRYNFGLRNDLQIRGIRPWRGADLQLGFQHIWDLSSERDDGNAPAKPGHGGWGITFQWVQDLGFGNNKLAVQYGRGGGTGFGTLSRFYYPDFSLNHDTSESRFRILDVATVQPMPWLGAQAVVVFQRSDDVTASAGDWISAGGRVVFGVLEHLKLLGEVGHDRFSSPNGSTGRSLTKASGAIAITAAKGFWARPELRLFVTYAQWDKNAATAGVDSFGLYQRDYATKLSAINAGIQAEAMW